MAGPLQAADDMVRIISNGLTFGGADYVASKLGEEDTAAKTAAARERAGFAGDLASMLGYGGGVKGVIKGLSFAPKIAKSVISKKGALAASLGLGGLVSYNARTATPAQAANTPPPVPAGKVAAGRNAAAPQASNPEGRPAKAAVGPEANYYDDMVNAIAESQGGAISIRQMMALGEAAQKGASANYQQRGGSKKGAGVGDKSGSILEQLNLEKFQKALADPNIDPDVAENEFRERTLELRKTQFIDPYGLQDPGAE